MTLAAGTDWPRVAVFTSDVLCSAESAWLPESYTITTTTYVSTRATCNTSAPLEQRDERTEYLERRISIEQ